MGNRRLLLGALWKLGIFNTLAVLLYRVRIRTHYFVKRTPITEFGLVPNSILVPVVPDCNEPDFGGKVTYFNASEFQCASPPSWAHNPYSNNSLDTNDQHWSRLPDFGLATGDVKVLWELSRFEWLIKACWQQVYGPKSSGIATNHWLLDWCEKNPANRGVNWKCAQEASIRVLHFVLAWLIHGEHPDNPDVNRFINLHIQRIVPTISYAKAQDNNHGTSEAGALFVLGVVLGQSEDPKQRRSGGVVENIGRKLLENRVNRLIDTDGTFSQYSVNYHRMMLDTLGFAECIRRRYERRVFSSKFYSKAAVAARWLHNMTDSISGDAPNIGANDGSVLFNCDSRDFRDFRPSVQLGMQLFCGKKVYAAHAHSLSQVFMNELKQVPDIYSAFKSTGKSKVFKRVGRSDTYGILKCPTNRFRPSQSDALHLDIWHNGVNLVRDAGTYSYNPPTDFKDDLSSTASHSTVEINRRNQMPKLSRFLYGAWLDSRVIEADTANSISSGYQDWRGGEHYRKVTTNINEFTVVDKVKGNCQYAILRWRLFLADWSLEGNRLTSNFASIICEADQPLEIVLGGSVESRYYLRLQSVVVLEIKAYGNVTFETKIELH